MAIVVDVLCVGSGPGAVGAALSAARAGMSVMYTGVFSERLRSGPPVPPAPSWTGVLLDRWGVQSVDRYTRSYLDEVTADVGEPDLADELDGVAVVENSSGPQSFTAAVPPFRGGALRVWSRQCLTSAAGVISTRVTLPGAVKVRSASGDSIELSEIITVPENGLGAIDLQGWLLSRAREHGVQVMHGQGLQRLLFSENQVFGGVIDTPSGSQVVQTRHGVVLGTGIHDRQPVSGPAVHARSRLCLSSRRASRFCRLELVPEQDPPHRARRSTFGVPDTAVQNRTARMSFNRGLRKRSPA